MFTHMLCLLCQGKPSFRCLFAPKNQAKAQAPPGKVRLLAYWLCARCQRRKDTLLRVERKLLAELATELSEPQRN